MRYQTLQGERCVAHGSRPLVAWSPDRTDGLVPSRRPTAGAPLLPVPRSGTALRTTDDTRQQPPWIRRCVGSGHAANAHSRRDG